MQRMIVYVAILLLVSGLAGCATFRGMAEDIKTLGRGIENATK
jgi:predicted small secreted protein